MTKVDILHRYTGAVLFTAEVDCAETGAAKRRLVMEQAVSKGVSLAGAKLRGVDLRVAYLQGANLEGADLRSVDLRVAYLQGANLEGADLEGANLTGADLWGAKLMGANLRGAKLMGANLTGADLWGANLDGFVSFGPCGAERRYGWATLVGSDVTIHLGCHTGDLDETCAKIQQKYGENSTYEALVRAAVAEMLHSRWANSSEASE